MYYPRSFLKLIVVGFLLVSLPLAYALAELVLSLDRLQAQGEVAVKHAAEAGRTSRLLYEQTSTLERIVRQYLILDDAALLDDYGQLAGRFRETIAQLAALPLEDTALTSLKSLAEDQERLRAQLLAPRRGGESAMPLVAGYARLTDGASAMLSATNQMIEHAINRLETTAIEGRQKSLYLALAAIAIALVLAIVFSVLIARPIRQLDHAIRRLGSADFAHAIEVNGPQDLRYLGQRLEWLRRRLSELEEQQNRFLRHVSHELKTPLTAVREGAELLRDRVGGDLSRQQQEIVRIVRENTLSLQKLIEDLLAYHQTRGAESQTMGPVALPDVVRRVVREHKLAAFARMVTFEARLSPAIVQGDAAKIRTIVDNLISNAIKYSPRAGLITLELGTEGEYALLDVSDQGPGVDAEDRPRIFDSFYQGKAPPEGRVKGSGLGLAIVRENVLAHGGRIELAERADGRHGARFRVHLPLAQLDLAAAPAAALAPAPPPATITGNG